MKKRNSKVISLIMLLLVVLMVYGRTNVFAAETKSAENKTTVTRAEWLSDLVDTFEMKVEDDNYPDNYFSDLQSSSEYYYKVLVAVQFGVVDVEAGNPIYPDKPTTREFAASTLNFCLGYQREKQDTTYTFSDTADVVDKVSAQIAVDHGWFALINGKFCPQNSVTSDEVTNMLADAKTIWNSTDVDQNYDNKYTLAKGVIEIPEDTDVYLLDDGRIYIAESPKEISVGDSFVVHLNGIPCGYKAEKIEKDNLDYVITASELSHEAAYKDADMQGTVDASALQVGEAADGLKVDYSEETGDTVSQGKARGSVNLDKYTTLKVAGKLKVGDQSISMDVKLKNAKIDYAISLTGETFVKLRGDSDVMYKCDLNSVKGMGLDEIPIIPAQIPGVGGIDLIAEISLGGQFNYKTSGYLVTGLSYSKANGFRIIKNFNAKSFSFICEANMSAGLKLRMGITGSALPINGYVYTTAGGKGVFRYTTYNSGLPKDCTTVVAYLYASTGAEASIKFGSILSASFNKETEIFGEDNSPIRTYHHYEDGKEVTKCSRGNDFKYYTNINSRYWGNGWTEGFGDYGYDADGNKVPLYTYTLDEDNNATITGYKGNASYLHIPETIDGYTVVGIGVNAFQEKKYIEKVEIPDTVTIIEAGAFGNCVSLTQIKIPDNVVKIGSTAFISCKKLQDIKLPKSLKSIGAWAFYDCDGLEEINVPCNIEEIPNTFYWGNWRYGCIFKECDNLKKINFDEGIKTVPSIFGDCKSLESVEIPDTVTTIGDGAFSDCINLGNVKIPDSVTKIGSTAFISCEKLKNVRLPKYLTSIGAWAFYNCDGIEEINVPCNIQEIPNTFYWGNWRYGCIFEECDNLKKINFDEGIKTVPSIFGDCKSLESVEIPDTVTTIGDGAFSDCINLGNVKIPDSVTKIGSTAFISCEKLKNVRLPKYLTSIGAWAFYNCDGIEEINVPCNIQEIPNTFYWGNWRYGCIFEECDNLKKINFDEGIKTVPSIFGKCKSLESVEIPNTVEKIAGSAFANCINLKQVIIPDSVKTLENDVFLNCSSLKEIKLPNTITSMGIYIFSGCTSLTDIILSDKIEYIAARMFENCTSLESITLPDTVITINDNAFNGCTSLKNIEWGKSLKYIKEYAFTNCTSLTSITIPDTVEKIEKGTFCNDSSLEKIELSKMLTELGYRMFYNCDALTVIKIPDSVTDLGKEIFYDCDTLIDVKLGTGINKIPDSAFEDCDKLASIVLPYRVESIGNYAFKNDVALTEVTIPRATTSISSSAFSYFDKLTIYGIPGTYAETFAKENEIKFVAKEVKATKVVLDKNELTLNSGERYTLKLSVEPEDFTDEVSWKSTNTDVVTVDDHGVVKAMDIGSATIKVVVGEQSTTCAIKVLQPVEDIDLKMYSISLDALDQYQLEAKVYPDNAYNKELEWKSEDETIATVSETGLVKAIKKGKTKIVVKAKDGSGTVASCDVTVINNAHIAKSVDEMESTHGYENDSSDFWVYTASGLNALNVTFDARTEVEDGFDYIYIYRADGKEVGKYTGKELSGATIRVPGNTVKIKLSSDDAGNAWGFKVTGITEAAAKKAQVISVADHIDKTYYDEEFNLNASVNTGDGALSYESENEDIVTVNEEGTVYIEGTGTVRVIVVAAETEEYEETRKVVEISVAKGKQNISVEYDSDTIRQEETQQIYVYDSCGTVTFESENPQIAIVDDAGIVTGIAPGEVGIVIKAEGDKFYEDYTERIVFHVVEKGTVKIPLSACEINLSDTVYVYDGTEKTPSVTVTYDNTELTENIDYILLYTDNIEPGTAIVAVEATENSAYTGTIQQNFEIRPALDENAVVVQPNAFEGCANLVNVNIKATVSEIGDQAFADCKNLRNVYFYGNCPKMGNEIFGNVKGTVYYPYNNTTWTLDKLQNYGGTITWCPWDPNSGKPVKRDMSLCKLTVTAKNMVYNGKAKTPKITVTDSGQMLQAGKDYTVSYTNNTKAGTGIVTVAGSGNYGGKISGKFIIGKAANKITAANITRNASTKKQTISSGVRVLGGAKRTYFSNSKYVKIDKNGKLTIAANFSGKVVITVKVSGTSCYKAALKKFTVTVKPMAVSITKTVNSRKNTVVVSWKGNKICSGYIVQYSTSKNFKSGIKTVSVNKNSTAKVTLSRLAKGKTYYIRIASLKKVGKTKILSNWSKVKSVKIRK